MSLICGEATISAEGKAFASTLLTIKNDSDINIGAEVFNDLLAKAKSAQDMGQEGLIFGDVQFGVNIIGHTLIFVCNNIIPL